MWCGEVNVQRVGRVLGIRIHSRLMKTGVAVPTAASAIIHPALEQGVLNLWDIAYTFFDASLRIKQTEHEFRKLNWYSTKSFVFTQSNSQSKISYASLYLVLNWALYLALNNDSTETSRYAMGVYIWFTLAVWWCGVTEIIQIRVCRFYDPGGRQNCGGKDFLAMLYYVTALPALMLFLMSHRFPTFIMMVIVFILIGTLIIPVQAIFARNLISFGLFSGFLLGLHHNKEMLKVAYKAQQKAQQAQSRASQAKRRFASYIFHEVRVPLNNAASLR
ncbi:hypothetical protein MPER_12604 [Moniliophthora perniciosa FA553]|nr:hypothetical protein MPER_12604 [Moniliophthora perniciosa FA553]